MGTRLLQILSFTNVAPAGAVPQAHGINIAGTPLKPDFVAGDQTGFAIAVTDTTVTVTNNNPAPASINVWLELKHTTPRELGGGIQNLSPQPFVAASGGSGGAGGIGLSKNTAVLPGGPFTVLDFYGGAVALYDLGGGVAAIEFNEQVFEKFSNGGEGTRFTVNLPGQRATIFYNVQVTMAVNDADTGATTFKQCRVINDTKTVNDFEVELSAAAQAGDKFYFTVSDRILPIILPP